MLDIGHFLSSLYKLKMFELTISPWNFGQHWLITVSTSLETLHTIQYLSNDIITIAIKHYSKKCFCMYSPNAKNRVFETKSQFCSSENAYIFAILLFITFKALKELPQDSATNVTTTGTWLIYSFGIVQRMRCPRNTSGCQCEVTLSPWRYLDHDILTSTGCIMALNQRWQYSGGNRFDT